MQSTLRPRLVAAALASLAAPACAAAGIAVFSDDFATPQTLAEHWTAEGEIRSEGGRLVVSPGAKATWRHFSKTLVFHV